MTDADNMSSEQNTEASPETVARAKEMGWVSPEEWKGAPPKNGFLDPAEYVRRGEKIMPIVRAEARKWQDEATKLRSQLETQAAEHSKTIARIERMSTLALENQRAQIEAQYSDRIEKAAELGDRDAVRQARKEEKEALAAIDKKMDEPEPEKSKDNARPEMPKAIQETVEAWKADNAWYTDDPTDEMTAYANARHMRLLKEKKGLSLKENLEQVTADVRKKFPEHFGADDDTGDDTDEQPARRNGSRVEGGSRLSGGNRSQWSKVPAEARQTAENAGHIAYFLEKGETMEKNAAQARERWAAKYFEGEKA